MYQRMLQLKLIPLLTLKQMFLQILPLTFRPMLPPTKQTLQSRAQKNPKNILIKKIKKRQKKRIKSRLKMRIKKHQQKRSKKNPKKKIKKLIKNTTNHIKIPQAKKLTLLDPPFCSPAPPILESSSPSRWSYLNFVNSSRMVWSPKTLRLSRD